MSDLLATLQAEKSKEAGERRAIIEETIRRLKKTEKPNLEKTVERDGFRYRYAKGKAPKGSL